jgi:hypothetical protein
VEITGGHEETAVTVSTVSVGQSIKSTNEDAVMISDPSLTQTDPAVELRAKTPVRIRFRDFGLWLREFGLGILGLGLSGVVAYHGFKASFIGLHKFAMEHLGLNNQDAWSVPITVDGGALVITIMAFRAAIHGRSAMGWRLGVLALTSLSAWINYNEVHDPKGKWLASLLPIIAVSVFESLMSEARKAHERRTGNVAPRLSLLRWCFDFSGTKAILRAHTLGQPLPEGFAEAAVVVEAERIAEEEAAKVEEKSKRKPKQTTTTTKTKTTAPAATALAKVQPEPLAPPAAPAPAPHPEAAPESAAERTAELRPVVVSIEHPFDTPDWLAEVDSPSAAMRRYLEENGERQGAWLEKWARHVGLDGFANGLGRQTLSRWRREGEPRANRDNSTTDDRDNDRDRDRDEDRATAVGEV